MAIRQNPYYPKQMNGPVISAFGQAVDEEFIQQEMVEDYLYNLSIDTANEQELQLIGQLIGYLRPIVPEGFNSENLLLLGTLPLAQDPDTGLSSVDNMTGGELTGLSAENSNYMELGTYRKFLKAVAYIKRYGITLYSINKVAASVSSRYTISWDEHQDIVINFTDLIGYKNIWILTQLFYHIATAPQVIITAGGDNDTE